LRRTEGCVFGGEIVEEGADPSVTVEAKKLLSRSGLPAIRELDGHATQSTSFTQIHHLE